MRTRATTDEFTTVTGAGSASAPRTTPGPAPVRPGWRARLVARLRGDYEEDGTYRPVRLSLGVDLAVSALIVAFVVSCWVGFFVWLAATQG